MSLYHTYIIIPLNEANHANYIFTLLMEQALHTFLHLEVTRNLFEEFLEATTLNMLIHIDSFSGLIFKKTKG